MNVGVSAMSSYLPPSGAPTATVSIMDSPVVATRPPTHQPLPLPFRFADGPFANRGVYSVIEEALAYWDQYLTAVEAEIATLSH